jgi:hypothetical protein
MSKIGSSNMKKTSFNLIINKKDNGNPIDTSKVVPIRGVA